MSGPPQDADRPARPEPEDPAPDRPIPDRPIPDRLVSDSSPRGAPALDEPRPGSPPRSPWRQLAHALRPRSVRGTVLATGLALALGLAVSTQISVTRDQGLTDLRPEELVRILHDVDRRADRLEAEARTLAVERQRLENGDAGGAAAVSAARKRVDTLAILVGTVPAQGPGIRIAVSDPDQAMEPTVVLDAVQELRDAGAEAIQVGAVRVVAATSVLAGPDGGVSVDGTPLGSSFTVLAIGDPTTMATAMAIPGGVEQAVRGVGATITVSQERSLRIDAVRKPATLQYAHQIPAP